MYEKTAYTQVWGKWLHTLLSHPTLVEPLRFGLGELTSIPHHPLILPALREEIYDEPIFCLPLIPPPSAHTHTHTLCHCSLLRAVAENHVHRVIHCGSGFLHMMFFSHTLKPPSYFFLYILILYICIYIQSVVLLCPLPHSNSSFSI